MLIRNDGQGIRQKSTRLLNQAYEFLHIQGLQANKNGAPGPIRTGDLRFRKPTLYPSELREQPLRRDQARWSSLPQARDAASQKEVGQQNDFVAFLVDIQPNIFKMLFHESASWLHGFVRTCSANCTGSTLLRWGNPRNSGRKLVPFNPRTRGIFPFMQPSCLDISQVEALSPKSLNA